MKLDGDKIDEEQLAKYISPKTKVALIQRSRGYTLRKPLLIDDIARICRIIKAAKPDLKPSQVSAIIKQTAIDYGKPGQDALFGSGEANAYRALMNIKK